MIEKTMIGACRDHFGYLPSYKGEAGLKGFAIEFKELTDKDKEDLKVEFAKIDIAIVEKPKP